MLFNILFSLAKRYPGEFGRKWPFLFWARKSYWSERSKLSHTIVDNSTLEANSVEGVGDHIEPADISALDSPSCFGMIKVEGLRKVFRSHKGLKRKLVEKVAVDGISVEFHQGQTLALLGILCFLSACV